MLLDDHRGVYEPAGIRGSLLPSPTQLFGQPRCRRVSEVIQVEGQDGSRLHPYPLRNLPPLSQPPLDPFSVVATLPQRLASGQDEERRAMHAAAEGFEGPSDATIGSGRQLTHHHQRSRLPLGRGQKFKGPRTIFPRLDDPQVLKSNPV